jgi:hypothetical protein
MNQDKVLAEIIDTGNPKIKSARITITAKPSLVFSILNNPKRHKEIDGSGTITENISGPNELILPQGLSVDSDFGGKNFGAT